MFCIAVVAYEKLRFGERASGFANLAVIHAVLALQGFSRLHKQNNPPEPKKVIAGPKIGPLDL